MNWVDLVVLAGVALAAVIGFRLGFVTRVLSWIGMLVGIVLALLVLGPLLDSVDPANQLRAVVIAVAVVLLGAFLGQAVGYVLGNRLRPAPNDEGLNKADADPRSGRRGGRRAAARVAHAPGADAARRTARHAGVGLVGRPRARATGCRSRPTRCRPSARSSATTTSPTSSTPSSRPHRSGRRRRAAGCRRPRPTPWPDRWSRSRAWRAARSRTAPGSSVEDGLVVTNAHVVAGEIGAGGDPRRRSPSGGADRALRPRPGPGAAARAGARTARRCRIAEPSVGDIGGVFGHPQGEPLRIAPFAGGRG